VERADGASLHVWGIRHHGPGSARSVRRALDDLGPDIVLVELPADAAGALHWVGRPGLIPPVALLGYAVDEPERAVFAPLASFSPEWQAVSWAAEHTVEVRPIDLPLAVTLAAGEGRRGRAADPLAVLAAAAGEPDPERWWDDMVEHRGDGEPVFAAIAEAMTAVRDGEPAEGFDGWREAHMRRAIRTALRAADRVAVICGAWHVPALDPAVSTAAADTAQLRGLPKVKTAVTWVPWTHRRLRRVTGYGAGVASPGWYAHVFRHPGPEGVARFFVDAAHALRRHGVPASPDHLIAASRLADSLATLRGRPRAGLAEVLDASEAVLGGRGVLALVDDELVVGDAIGEVPAGAPQVPLARDLAAAQRAARLRPDAASRTVELDLRTPNGLRRSRLLHRLVALDVPWGELREGRGSSGTFRETWRLSWEPELSVRLVEVAGHGTTLVGAATSRLGERVAAAGRLAEVTTVIELALLADLPDALEPALRRLGVLAAQAPDAAELMDALAPLAATLRYGDVRGTDGAGLRSVFDELVVRVVAELERAARGVDEDAAAALIERMSAVQGALATVDHPARRDEWPAALELLADDRRGHGLVRGRATRLLHDLDRDERVEQRLGQALTAGTPPSAGAAFVEGFLAGSGTILLHDAALRATVDTWICSLRAETFADVAPLLRRTFGAFEPAERRRLGQLVSTGQTDRAVVVGDDLDPDRIAAGLETVRAMLGLPSISTTLDGKRKNDSPPIKSWGNTR
jgi:hypothetical protein